MKELKTIKTATGGQITIYQDDDGNLTTSKPVSDTYVQFVVTDDPSRYAKGLGLDTLEAAHDLRSELNELKAVDQTLYIIELHYPDKSDNCPPVAVYAHDENDKRVRII